MSDMGPTIHHDVGHGADDPRSALFHPLYDAIFQPVLVGDRKEWREKNFVPVQTVLRVDDVHIVVAEGGIILFNKLGTVIEPLDERRALEAVQRAT